MAKRAPKLLPFPRSRGARAFCLKGVMGDYSTAHLHHHEFHQILFIRSGITVLADDTRKIPLWGDMCALIPAGIAHHSLVIGERVTYQSLYVRKPLLELDGQIRVFRIGHLANALLDRLSRKNWVDVSTGLEGECLALLLKLCLADSRRRLKHLLLPVPRTPAVRKMVDYIDANDTGPISLQAVADHAGYSKRHADRLFASEMRIPIFEYVRLHRAFRVSFALARERTKITTVALDCGYETMSAFYRDFKRYFGATPRKFRKETQGM